jgi:hypothetical protein
MVRWWRLRLPDDHDGHYVDIDLLDYRATNDDLHAAAYVVAYDVDVPRLRAEHSGQHDDYRDDIEQHNDPDDDAARHVEHVEHHDDERSATLKQQRAEHLASHDDDGWWYYEHVHDDDAADDA